MNFKTQTNEITISDLDIWNYDGSSTDQAEGHDSEILLVPIALFKDPFRTQESHNEPNYLVLCEMKKCDGTLFEQSSWSYANDIFKKDIPAAPWFGIEQEYFIIDNKTGYPLGFPDNESSVRQGQYYCSVGSRNAFGREFAEEHFQLCLKAGLTMSGMNAEVAPGQWEYQVGPCEGIECGNQVWISRYILERLSEKFNYTISLHPKPVTGDCNGSGCHTNFSTKLMREGNSISQDEEAVCRRKGKCLQSKTGLDLINEAICKLEKTHKEHMELYGFENEKRMTGEHETSDFTKFSYGVGNRKASIRIPNKTQVDKKGYFEDRRPGSNMDPYLVSAKLFETCQLK